MARKSNLRRMTIGAAAVSVMFATVASFSARAADEQLPPCQPDKPIPASGCMGPPKGSNELGQFRPAPPLQVIPAPGTPEAAPPSPGDSPPVITPPSTGDQGIAKQPLSTADRMPVTPAPNPQAK